MNLKLLLRHWRKSNEQNTCKENHKKPCISTKHVKIKHAISTLMLITYVMKDKIITLLLTLAFSALILMLWPVLAYIFKIEDKDSDP